MSTLLRDQSVDGTDSSTDPTSAVVTNHHSEAADSSSAEPAGTSNPEDPGNWGITDEDVPFWELDENISLLGSMLVHLIVFLSLALVQLRPVIDPEAVVIVSPPPEFEKEIELIEEVEVSEMPQTEVGANALAEFDLAEASAPTFAEIAEIPNPIDLEPTDLGDIMVNKMFSQPVAPQDRLDVTKGQVGKGIAGASGAVDQITFEIMQSAEERATLVVWLFDESGSLMRQRTEIRDRFDRIYEELGIVGESLNQKRGADEVDPRVMTSIIGFGEKVQLYTAKPTADLGEIKSIVDQLPVDSSGMERVFTAIESAADQYKSMRRAAGPRGPQKNVLFVVVTDERGDDTNRLESSITSCRRFGIPVYVIGVPAPFGREHTFVKYVDPDPEFDQTPQWAQVDQGPETFLPERIQLGFTANFQEEPPIDSGFGPYGLTRLCYETGGIYFAVHPNRNVDRRVSRREVDAFASDLKYFFDPVVMSRYRPDYLSQADYVTAVKASPLRQSLIRAAQVVGAEGLRAPRTRFVKRDEAQLAGELTTAQQDAAKLEPHLMSLALVLEQGWSGRETEESPRWRAGYDLALGRVLAQKVRTETYNAMLAQAKRGMPFQDAKNNTWVIEPADEVTVGSKWEREAGKAKELLEQVVNDHEGTPWALLAKQELDAPIGWKWAESFTDLSPPPQRNRGNNNNNNNRPPRDDERRMLNRAPKRPVPKL
ncbi:MAG: vWA domain-containing protein [Planctomycetota bacterium]